jgi:hypothetical protein
MANNAEIFFEHDRWGHNVAWSVALHVLITGGIVLYAAVASGGRRETWGIGGTGEAMGVTLVSTVPLPASPTQTQNVLANESKGVAQSLPKAEEKEPDAIAIPDRDSKQKPRTSSTRRKPLAEPVEEASQRALWNFQRGWSEGRIWLHRRRRRLRHSLRLVRARGATESFGELAEVRSGSGGY